MSFYRPPFVMKDDDNDSVSSRNTSVAQQHQSQVVPTKGLNPPQYFLAIAKKDVEISNLKEQVKNLAAKVQSQELAMANQAVKIQQQAETIRIHSKEISKPPVDKMALTPFRGLGRYGTNNPNLMQGPPPIFNPSVPTFQPALANSVQTKWGPIVENRASRQLPPGLQAPLPANNGSQFLKPAGQTSGNSSDANKAGASSITTVPQGMISALNKTAQPPTEGLGNMSFFTGVNILPASLLPGKGTKNDILSAAWYKMFEMAMCFAYNHLNTPSNQLDSRLPQQLKEKLMEAATKTTAARLLASQKTRYFMVGRIIIEWINRLVFKEQALKGVDEGIDRAIDNICAQLQQNHPSAVRYVYREEMRKQFQAMTSNNKFEQHVSNISNNRASQLWEFIKPLKITQTHNVQSELLDLMVAAHKLAFMLFCDTAEYRLFFFEANVSFDPATMVNMDGDYANLSGAEVAARHGAIRLTVGPQVMARTIAADGSATTEILIHAGVLLKFREESMK